MHPEFALTLLHVISISLLGAVNALIFGMNRQTLKEFQWSNFKVNVELHTFSLRSQTPPCPASNMCALLQEKRYMHCGANLRWNQCLLITMTWSSSSYLEAIYVMFLSF